MAGRDSPSLVSVIIPTYNRSDLLQLTVESVLAQTYPNIEIIVVDDGSTDDTAAVMAQYAGRVTYIQRPHVGSGGRIVGLGAASGEYINFLDHDDLFMPTKIERQVQVLDTRPEIGLVHCGYYHIDEDGNILDKTGLLPEEDMLKELARECFIWSGAPLIRRQCLAQAGLCDEEACLYDRHIWLRIAQAGYRFTCIQEPLGAYRILPDSQMTNTDRLEDKSIAVLDKVFANPQLPADVVAVKEEAYGGMRFWIGCSYYAAGLWDDAKRNMTEALALRPQLLEHPEGFLHALTNIALHPEARIGTPIKFISDVFEHLPPGAGGLGQYRSHALSRVYTGLALRNYAFGHIVEAKRQLAQAITLDPAMFNQPETFVDFVYHYAVRLPVSAPLVCVETMFQNLPEGAQGLKRIRTRVLGDLSIAYAFDDYHAGRQGLVARQVLTGLRYRPAWLGNRGVVSILLKSLPKSSIKERGIRHYGTVPVK